MNSRSFSELTDINNSILSLAEASEWEKLSEKAVLRQQKVESLFASQDEQDLEQLILLEKQIKAVDSVVLDMIEKQKKLAIKNSLDLKKTQSAIKAYHLHDNP